MPSFRIFSSFLGIFENFCYQNLNFLQKIQKLFFSSRHSVYLSLFSLIIKSRANTAEKNGENQTNSPINWSNKSRQIDKLVKSNTDRRSNFFRLIELCGRTKKTDSTNISIFEYIKKLLSIIMSQLTDWKWNIRVIE